MRSASRGRRRFTPTRVGTTRVRRPGCCACTGSPPHAWGRPDDAPRLYAGLTVHPHTRGDNAIRRAVEPSSGSPPHAWGRRHGTRHALFCSRFTPTRVGTTSNARVCQQVVAGSPPHAWGRLVTLHRADVRAGSPPHAWGRRAGERRFETGRARFTPTRVGTTVRSRADTRATSVHPHTRGDDVSRHGANAVPSVHPHARGDDCTANSSRRSTRFTPTRVGTTASHDAVARLLAVHPHTRGDDKPLAVHRSRRAPVHPHTRGDNGVHGALVRRHAVHPHTRGDDRCHRADTARVWRFTPTRVGTTPIGRRQHATENGSPPHAWGQQRRAVSVRQVGSPPHAWGRRVVARCASLRLGSPPHAWGRRRCRATPRRADAVHPHTRGDNVHRRSVQRH